MVTFLIISPNAWGDMHISKHNYAITLSQMGYQVYFMNPPNQDQRVKDYEIKQIDGYNNLYIINIYLLANRVIDYLRIRLNLTFICDFLLLKLVIKIFKSENVNLDYIWSFDPNLHGYLFKYPARKKLFFIADQIKTTSHKRAGKNVDIVVSVAQEILKKFELINNNCLLVNHGINNNYARFAVEHLSNLENKVEYPNSSGRIQVGYIGNLLISCLYAEGLKKIVVENPDIDFNFWGAYEVKNNNLANDYDKFIYETIHWIKDNCPNTYFWGIAKSNEIIGKLDLMDVFIYINNSMKDVNGGSNSHKILEYLTTGKVIVSTYLSYYSSFSLFPMTQKGREKDYVRLFNNVVTNLAEYNAIAKQKERIAYTLENTYVENIKKIIEY